MSSLLQFLNKKLTFAGIHTTMSHLMSIAGMHTLEQRTALKDLLLSKVTTDDLKERVQLFEQKVPDAGKSQVAADTLEMRKNKLLGSLVKELK